MRATLPFFIAFFVILASCNSVEQKKTTTSLSDETIELLIERSEILYQYNEYEKVIPIFDRIVAIDSTRGETYYRRGYCKAQFFEYEESSNDYLKAIKLNYRVADSYFSLGCNYAAIYNDSLALKYFQKAFELNPTNENAKREAMHFRKRLGIT